MRFREIDSGPDVLHYLAQVYNPLGYVRFAFEEDKDWWEKAEHTAIASATVAIPFHVLTAMSTGGYWANLPPGMSWRAASYKKFTHQLFYNFMRNVIAISSRVPSAVPVVALSVGAAAGWIATAEHHGAVTPGVASGFGMPITNPGAAHSPTPYRQGLRDMFGLN